MEVKNKRKSAVGVLLVSAARGAEQVLVGAAD
jgi:hypothetical protein